MIDIDIVATTILVIGHIGLSAGFSSMLILQSGVYTNWMREKIASRFNENHRYSNLHNHTGCHILRHQCSVVAFSAI